MLATNSLPQAPSNADPPTSVDPPTPAGPEFDLASITLISNLESIMASFRVQTLAHRVETASKTASAILLTLLDFSDQYFNDTQAERLQQELVKASDARNVHDAVLANRPWGAALKNVFRAGYVDSGAMSTYEHLGRLLLRTCGTAFVEIAELLGTSAVSAPIKQSCVVFLKEVESNWS